VFEGGSFCKVRRLRGVILEGEEIEGWGVERCKK
jgi:hypothetical protein